MAEEPRPATRQDPGFIIVKPSSLGDIVHALPSFAALRRAYPESRISWIANSEWIPLLKHVPDLDVLIPFPRSDFRGPLALPRFFKWCWKLRESNEFPGERIFDLQGLIRSALMGRARPQAKVVGSLASREGAHLFYHVRTPDPGFCHAVDHCLSIMQADGIPIPDSSEHVEFPLGRGDRPEKPLPDSFVLLHPYSRGAGKSIAHEDIPFLLESFAPRKVVVVGHPAENALSPEGDHITNLCGQTTLGELLWLCRNASSVVSVDSGPLHIAAAVNPNVVGIHTWSDPRRVGPYTASSLVWKGGILGRVAALTAEAAAASTLPTRSDLREIATAGADA